MAMPTILANTNCLWGVVGYPPEGEPRHIRIMEKRIEGSFDGFYVEVHCGGAFCGGWFDKYWRPLTPSNLFRFVGGWGRL